MKKLSKKSVLLAAIAILAAAALTGCAIETMAMPFQGMSQTPAATEPVNSSVNLEEAKAIAFAKAGVAEAEAYDKDFDFEQGNYEIDFEHGGLDYEYKISAATGEILFESIKPDNDPKPQQPTAPETKPEQQPTQPEVKPEQPAKPANNISLEEAKAAAFAAAGIAEADVYDKDYDFEHGVYEIDFEHGGNEYEYKINASTGEIVYQNVKPDGDRKPQQQNQPQQPTQSGNKVSPEDARSSAFAAAGVNENEVYDKDFDFEHGRYEVDFEKDGVEYEYVIDAETGKVIYEHSEPDDDRYDRDDDWDDRYDRDDDWDDRYDD